MQFGNGSWLITEASFCVWWCRRKVITTHGMRLLRTIPTSGSYRSERWIV